MTDPLVVAHALTKKFDPSMPAALDGLQFSLERGKLIALAGPDGAGKTTLIRSIAGLLEPTSGNITVGGYDVIKQQRDAHSLMSYMPQRFGLYEDLTVMQNLTLYADLQLVGEEEKKERFESLLSFTNLKKFQDRLAKNLSGGMKQKLGLACTLIRKPELLLLDEPTVGVDPISRRELWEMIFSLIKQSVTVVCSTCYLDEAEKCDKVLLLEKGRILFNGPPKEMTDRCLGRTFLLKNGNHDKRVTLSRLISQPDIIDGTISGTAIRIVTKTTVCPDLSSYGFLPQNVIAAPPRFEDAYIDLLGGGPKQASPLVTMLPKVPRVDTPQVDAEHLVKKFGSFTAVNDVSFKVAQGEIFGLLGPNGAGKSTTFKMLCGLLKPTAGVAFVSGHSLLTALSTARSRIGYMAQKFSLYDNMSVAQNLNFFHGIYNNSDTKIMQAMIDIFDLQPFLNETALQLPFGYKQRLALACSLMHNPSVLFLDEPTSGVDPITRREFWNHINGMVAHGVAVVVTTHFMEEAEYCDRIALINQGRVIKMGTPDELKEMVASSALPQPTIEDAFVILSKQSAAP